MTDKTEDNLRECYTPGELRWMLIQTDQTCESFRQDVIERIRGFVREHHDKIDVCLIGIHDTYVQVTLAQHAIRHDAELQDHCSDFELALAENGWSNVNTFLLPAVSEENLDYMHRIAMSGED